MTLVLNQVFNLNFIIINKINQIMAFVHVVKNVVKKVQEMVMVNVEKFHL